jgi:hypothetical protein
MGPPGATRSVLRIMDERPMVTEIETENADDNGAFS